ncbi:MAG: hypothetical protein KatS3mg124_1746 [Porticoccaceae bacterium]|nr:MAG: hypothetical protein KatS3mg124_1746 [Porticoccaceae bacterium]
MRAGEYDKYGGALLYNYGAEHWAVKLTAAVERQNEGYLDNLAGGDTWDRDLDRYGVHLLWEPNEIFTAEAIVDYSNLDGTPSGVFLTDIDSKDTFCFLTQVFDSLGVPPGGVYCSGKPGEPATGDRDKVALDGKVWNELEQWQTTFRLTANVTEDHTLTYIGSWLTMDDDQQHDGDGTPYEIYHFRRWGDFDQVTHELRLSRESGSPLTWQVGLYQEFAEGTLNQHTVLTLLGCDLGGDPCTYEFTRSSSDTYSIYGEADYALLDERLVFTAGARYINQTKKLDREVFNIPLGSFDVGPHAGGTRTDSDIIYRLGARYHFTDDVMGYLMTSTGFRSGGLSPRAQTPQVLERGYEPETLTNYEAGLRTTLLDGTLNFNVTAFRMDYEDMQIELAVPSLDEQGNVVGTGTQLAIENAGEARFEGVEVEFAWMAADWWRLSGNLGWLDAEYEELFVNIWGDQDANGNLLPPQDESNLEPRRAPEWNYGLTSTMTFAAGGGELSWRISYSWTDDYEGTITNYPGSAIEDYGILDSSLIYRVDRWQFSLFGRNLTDEDAWTHTYVVNPVRPTATDPAPGTLWRFALRRPPREIGAELLYQF